MQVKSIAECSKWNILQYFRPSLSYHLLLRSLFCLFLSGCFTQVLVLIKILTNHKHKYIAFERDTEINPRLVYMCFPFGSY